MNLSLLDNHGGLIIVPQFTLVADTKRGNRPSFGKNVSTEIGKQYFQQLITHAKKEYNNVQHGVFGADMQVTLTNDGPVTFWLEV
jgi:D-tyrosyl-tRNA(Tyr) deacylase